MTITTGEWKVVSNSNKGQVSLHSFKIAHRLRMKKYRSWHHVIVIDWQLWSFWALDSSYRTSHSMERVFFWTACWPSTPILCRTATVNYRINTAVKLNDLLHNYWVITLLSNHYIHTLQQLYTHYNYRAVSWRMIIKNGIIFSLKSSLKIWNCMLMSFIKNIMPNYYVKSRFSSWPIMNWWKGESTQITSKALMH